MIFDVEPSQIEKLNSTELVELLRKLLYAEAQDDGISLRVVSAPLQITVPDGGEDARVSWKGGNESTNYFPSRFCLFQSKAGNDKGPTFWKKAVWKDPTALLITVRDSRIPILPCLPSLFCPRWIPKTL